METNIQNFFKNMAAQFRAGFLIIETIKNNQDAYHEAENAINRDIDSFCVEANKCFSKEFNENDFRQLIG